MFSGVAGTLPLPPTGSGGSSSAAGAQGSTSRGTNSDQQQLVHFCESVGIRSLARNGKYLAHYKMTMTTTSGGLYYGPAGGSAGSSSFAGTSTTASSTGVKNSVEIAGVHPFPRTDGTSAPSEWSVHRFAPEKRFTNLQIGGSSASSSATGSNVRAAGGLHHSLGGPPSSSFLDEATLRCGDSVLLRCMRSCLAGCDSVLGYHG